ncbi:Phosphatase [Magnetospirillum sp. LM-5]|uniref:HAD family hydrolase n=1 Tax=Magnetospirillum sp. LM-5 TaxID=2681466 RepID=UPI0013824ABF|nr:HAD hydrolase-like protein [Magnetospirillum sp. LM-5]CAA7613400.1 Phosphatase [Magnetospirillum sp. LM-5]
MTIRPRAILFDWDNTLVDSWLCIQEAYNRTFRHFAMAEWSLDQTKANVARSLRDTFPEMFGERWLEAKDVFYQSFEAIHLSHLRPLPGAQDMLEDLQARGIYLAVVSNKRGQYLRQEAELLGWAGFFGALVGAADALQDKPAAAPVHLALSSAPVAAGPEVWFAGDAGVDLECAVNAGCVPVLIRPEPPQPGEFASHPPRYYLEKCQSMTALMADLWVPNAPI